MVKTNLHKIILPATFGIVFTCFALLFAWSTVRSLSMTASLLIFGKTTEGRVVSIYLEKSGRGTTERPVIEFSANGQKTEFIDPSDPLHQFTELNGVVPVIYLPDSPKVASVNTLWYLWYHPIAGMMITLIWAVSGFLFIRAAIRKLADSSVGLDVT